VRARRLKLRNKVVSAQSEQLWEMEDRGEENNSGVKRETRGEKRVV